MKTKFEKEKSSIVVRTVVLRNGKEEVVEEVLDDVQGNVSPVSDEKLNELFDLIYPEDMKKGKLF